MGLKIIILAAGKGKRMSSDLPKVLQKIGGSSLLEHVINTATQLNPDDIIVIHGNGGFVVREVLSYLPVHWVEQKQQLGTGHAVLQAIPFCDDGDQVLVLYGDVPLITTQTLHYLLNQVPTNGLALIVTEHKDPTGFGRIIRNTNGNIVAIVEHKDATLEQLLIREINTGILTTSAKNMKSWLPRVRNINKQNEYYLTDIIALAVEDGCLVEGVMADCADELQGVNDHWQLASVERYYQHLQAKKLALAGVTIKDPTRLDIRGNVSVGADVILDINVILEGQVSIGKGSTIGANAILKNVEIGQGVTIFPNCIIEGAKISDNCSIGPFARIRPNTVIKENAMVGNFVEIKKTHLGEGSKAMHLTYLGDAVIGKNVNIGAGTITCNYDGLNKWETQIGDNVFIGSNTSLIAPVSIGINATIGAGSAISANAPADQLTLARARQETIKNWESPKQKADSSKVESG